MKTTLKYNTIESFQRQPAWKKFIDTIVDGCKGLFDDHLIAEFEDGENVTKNNKSISNIKLSESNEGVVPQMDLENLRPKYSVLNYLEDGIPLTAQENISLKGLLRTLSLYGCRIKDIDFYKLALPHTYKESRDVFEVENIYGFYTDGGTTYDEPVQAIVDGDSGQNVDGVVGNNEEDITDEYKSRYKYIHNIYGYNQKHPVISYTRIKEIIKCYSYEKKEGIGEGLPNCFYVLDENITLDSVLYESIDENYSEIREITSEMYGGFFKHSTVSELATLLRNLQSIYDYTDTPTYKCVYADDIKNFVVNGKAKDDLLNNGGYIEYNTADSENTYELLFSNNNNINPTLFTKVFDSDNNPIRITLSNGVTYYVYEENSTHQYLCFLNEATSRFNISLPYLKNQLFSEECTIKAQPLFGYNDLKIKIVLNNSSDVVKLVSMCANTIDTTGGIDKITYEVEDYEKLKINATIEAKSNVAETPLYKWKQFDMNNNYIKDVYTLVKFDDYVSPYPADLQFKSYFFDWNENKKYLVHPSSADYTNNVEKTIGGYIWRNTNEVEYLETENVKISDTYQGDYFYKWEQFADNGTYVQDVYTLLKFDELKGDYESNANYNYFFNGYNEVYPITNEDYTNNSKKVIDGYTYVNTYQLEYFETMYFNHFIKVSPIDGVVDGDTIKTTKLYCDNLELVEFGDVVPYVVSYDRKGEMESVNNEPSEIYDDIDCAIFSKILCYNKHTHLLTVDKPVYFNKYGESEPIPNKYVVVAYQNVSPFNKISSMNIVTPDSVKNVVAGLLNNYKNDYKYKLNLFTEAEYQEYLESLQS